MAQAVQGSYLKSSESLKKEPTAAKHAITPETMPIAAR